MRFGEVVEKADGNFARPRPPFFSNPVFELWYTVNPLKALLNVLFYPCTTNSRHLRLVR